MGDPIYFVGIFSVDQIKQRVRWNRKRYALRADHIYAHDSAVNYLDIHRGGKLALAGLYSHAYQKTLLHHLR